MNSEIPIKDLATADLREVATYVAGVVDTALNNGVQSVEVDALMKIEAWISAELRRRK